MKLPTPELRNRSVTPGLRWRSCSTAARWFRSQSWSSPNSAPTRPFTALPARAASSRYAPRSTATTCGSRSRTAEALGSAAVSRSAARAGRRAGDRRGRQLGRRGRRRRPRCLGEAGIGSMIGAKNDPWAWVRVANVVVERIASREIAPGGPVPSKADLAAELGVSQDTVRRAFRELATEGMIVRIPGRRYLARAGSNAPAPRA